MSIFTAALMVVLAVLAVVWQIRYARLFLWLRGEDGASRYCILLVVLFFAGFVVYHGYHETVTSPEFKKAWDANGVGGVVFRSSVLHVVTWLAIKSLLFGLTTLACLALAPVFLLYCVGAVAFIYLEGIDRSGIPPLNDYANWLFEGAPPWVSVWYVRLQIAVSVVFTQVYRDWDPRSWGERRREFIRRWTQPLAGFCRLLLSRFSPPSLGRGWEGAPPDLSGRNVPQSGGSRRAPGGLRADSAEAAEEARFDAVLNKIAHSGQESLTPEEREFLARQAERFRPRSGG